VGWRNEFIQAERICKRKLDIANIEIVSSIDGGMTMKTFFTVIGIVLGIFISSSSLFAQLCLSAKPAPQCRSCFITEFGYGYKITPPLKRASISMIGNSVTDNYEWKVTGRHYLTSEVGYIYNLNAQYGLGFTHFTGWDIGHNLRGGVKLRLRKWLNPKTSLDLSGGAFLWNIKVGTENYVLERSTFMGGASLNFSECQAVNVMVEVLETKPYSYFNGVQYRNFWPRRRNVGIYLGYKLSSKPGLVLNGITLGTVAVVGVLYVLLAPNFLAWSGSWAE
jgi:hypothetical protein